MECCMYFEVIVASKVFSTHSGVEYVTFSFSLQLLKHSEKDCPLTITSCPYVQMGCATKVSCFLAKFRVTNFILKGFFFSINICRFFFLFLFLLFKKKLTVLFHLHKPVHNRPFYRCGPGGVGHGSKGIMGKKSKTAHLHLTFALFTSLVTP